MKAKFLSVLSALTMVLSLLPTTVLADNEADTLPAAENGVITLNKNVSISEWAVEEDVTLDLNGCTFTTTKDCGVDISGGATLTIIDSGENGTLTSSGTPIRVTGAGSKVIINSGAIVSTNNYGIYA